MFRSSPRLPGLRSFAFTSEHAWGTLGCTIALASGGFAVYMNLYGPSEPNVNGREYLTIFAQASHRTLNPATSDAAAPADPQNSPEIDPFPTGSIAPGEATQQSAAHLPIADKRGLAKPSLLKDFTLRDVFEDTALVEDHARLRIVKVGTVLEGAGRVTSIEQRDGQWIVVTSLGVIAGRPTSDK